MAQGFRYDKMVENALRGVLREALTVAARDGLPGAHHFYITFRTRHPGVVMPDYLRAKHPEEITIVLQHQFWGLDVTDSYFEVTLAFNRVNERLHVPFAAVLAFADPSAKFGLQFQVETEPAVAEPPRLMPAAPVRPAADAETEAQSAAKTEAKPADGEAKGQVIALDAFRKK